MKRCNLCHSIVDEENECPVCHNTLTYEPICHEREEHFVWNKYYVAYLAKNVWFSLICCMMGLLKVIIARPQLNALLFAAGTCALISLTVSVFQRTLSKTMTWKYCEEYVPFKLGIWKYLLGGVSILFFIFQVKEVFTYG
mgnify:CR=1 FL=1